MKFFIELVTLFIWQSVFVSALFLLGNYLTKKIRADYTESVYFAMIVTIGLSLLVAKIGTGQKYLFGLLSIVLIYLLISYIKNSLKFKISFKTSSRVIAYSVILFVTSLFGASLSSHLGKGIFSPGNVDPINYMLLSKHVSKYGFSSKNDFLNHNLGFHASWDWPGVHGFVSLIDKTTPNGIAYNYSWLLAFFASIFCIGLWNLKENLLNSNNLQNQLIHLSITIYLLASSLTQYIFLNGFLAQIIVMSLLPHILNSVVMFRAGMSGENRMSKVRFFFYGYGLGTLGSIYLPLTLIILTLIVASIFKLYSKIGLLEFFTAILGLIIGIWYLHFYLFTSNANLILTSNSNGQPGWPIQGNIFWYFLPWNQVCLPGLASDVCAKNNTPAHIWASAILILILVLLYSRNINKIKIRLANIWLLMLTAIIIVAGVWTGITSYRFWKILGSIQVIYFLLIILPILHFEKINTKKKSKNKMPTISREIISLLAIILFILSSVNLMSSYRTIQRSPYYFQTAPNLLNLQKINMYGLNIDLAGVNGMLAALYVNSKTVNLTQPTPFYSANSKNPNFPTLIFKNGIPELQNN